MQTVAEKQHVIDLLSRLDPNQLTAVVQLLEVMTGEGGDELTSEDRRAIADSRRYFRENPDGGLSFEQMIADCGFTMDQIRKHRPDSA
ncbi:MAG: hypothetical protein ACRD6B_14360 [Bryobacteraceae bacterium]